MSINVADIQVQTMQGETKSLGDYRGQVLLIVNVASYCGYTRQYSSLESLNQTYRDRGLRVLGFPCNDFGAQEPDSTTKIKLFCETRYGVSFELFDKLRILGSDRHPLYERLSQVPPPGDVAWNFTKFLVGKTGDVLGRYKSSVTPESADLVKAIEAALTA